MLGRHDDGPSPPPASAPPPSPQMLGMKISEDELDAMVAEIDKDGSGEVDFEEFLLIMSKRKDGSDQAWAEGEVSR